MTSLSPFSALMLILVELVILRSRTLLTCTTKGKASMRSIEVTKVSAESSCSTVKSWNVCASGTIAFSKVDISENFSLFGG